MTTTYSPEYPRTIFVMRNKETQEYKVHSALLDADTVRNLRETYDRILLLSTHEGVQEYLDAPDENHPMKGKVYELARAMLIYLP